MNINRNFKDSLFRKLFSDKENLLSLINALSGTSYANPDDIQINTIDNTIFKGMQNDVSCILDGNMYIIEHQSTVNPNMPFRCIVYYFILCVQLIMKGLLNPYSKKLMKLPSFRCYVLYNGDEEQPDRKILRFTDAFIHNFKGGREWSTATMLNINYGHNKKLMSKCRVLEEYSIFVAKIKYYRKMGLSSNEAVKRSIDDGIRENVLMNYLTAEKVMSIMWDCIVEYSEEEAVAAVKEEWCNIVKADERTKNMITAITCIMQDYNGTFEDACRKLGIAEHEREQYKKMLL